LLNNFLQTKLLIPACLKKISGYSLILIPSLLISTAAFAQQVPDAGTILREQEQGAPDLIAPPSETPAIGMPQAGETAGGGPTLVVEGFEFSGNTLIPSDVLQNQLSELLGEELTLGQLQTAGFILTGYYAEEGYLARFVLPPQDVVNGIVRFDVVEGVRGDIQVNSQGQRINSERVRAFIESRLQAGQIINMNMLGEALNILNEQPGVNVTGALEPGDDEREITFDFTATETPLLSYSLSINNYGSRGTGQEQLNLGLGIANLAGQFDLLSLGLNKTEGTTSGSLGYGLALGNRGLRLNVDATVLDYELTQSQFTALQAEGDAQTLGVDLSFPLSRRSGSGADISARLQQRELEDSTVAGETGDRTVRSLNLSWDAYRVIFDGWWSGSLALTVGDSEQKNATASATDAVTRNSFGGYAKFGFKLSHLRALNENWTLSGSFNGQLANTNLDSSERLSLGGLNGVRGFPVSEGTGDEGYIARINLIREWGVGQVGTFIDYGRIHINHTDFISTSSLPNWYSLSSVGVSLNWQYAQRFIFNATLAQPISGNPGSADSGNNTDGSSRSTEFWFSMSALF
tara:strand:- start:28710 stop:30437 length:1728 start_codon:yes stop_codon:yes gene_type:complete